jgi:hypothetical protein
MGTRAYTTIFPAEFDGHYEAVCRGFEAGDLTAPSLAISDMQLARAISAAFAKRNVDPAN